jgi:NlpC/P60 family putative phage cell wall peptidase
MTRGEELVARARQWLGTPYLHQASCKGAGSDCLGLLRGLWRETYGAEPFVVPAYTQDWSEASGREELLGAAEALLRPCGPAAEALGDVLVFRMRPGAVAKHLGLLSGVGSDARFIHAYSGHGVVESALTDPWRRKVAGRFRFPEGV